MHNAQISYILGHLQAAVVHCIFNLTAALHFPHMSCSQACAEKVDTAGACCCPQVAEAAAQHASHLSEASGKHEAAVYSTLAGHLHRILPVCHASADILWAYTRCWLESQVDQHLAKSSDKGDLAKGLRLGKDAVAATQRDHPEEVRRVVLDDVADFWPCSRYHTDLLAAGPVPVSFCRLLQVTLIRVHTLR